MKKIFIIVFVIALFSAYFLNDILAFFIGVPPQIYYKYSELKNKYGCGNECFSKIEICSDKNSSKFFKVWGGYKASTWKEFYFDKTGSLMCNTTLIVDVCRQGSCVDQYKNCPPIAKCEIIIKNRLVG